MLVQAWLMKSRHPRELIAEMSASELVELALSAKPETRAGTSIAYKSDFNRGE